MGTGYDAPAKVCTCPDCHDYSREGLCVPCVRMGCDGKEECRVQVAFRGRVALRNCQQNLSELVTILREIEDQSGEGEIIRKARAAADSVEGSRHA